ncbi:MAG: DUF4139 domain-containing protein [Candidatus Diapherotrites archaeon]|nr:DUF4139 domain-containing protein [Candidatus Diapherotrites archaeon]
MEYMRTLGIALVIGIIALGLALTLQETSNSDTLKPQASMEYSALQGVHVQQPNTPTANFQQTQNQNVELTVYQQNLALVKEKRPLTLVQGINTIAWDSVAKQLNAETVLFQDLSGNKAQLVQHTYSYDVASQEKLLEKYLNQTITVETDSKNENKTITGKLIFTNPIGLETGNGIVSIYNVQSITFPDVSGTLSTQPTLTLVVNAPAPNTYDTQLAYLTTGMTWSGAYTLQLKENNTLDLTANAHLTNNAGASYENVQLKIVAGDLRTVSQGYPRTFQKAFDAAGAPATAGIEGFNAPTELGEYYEYALTAPVSIQDQSSTDITLFKSSNVSYTQEYAYDGQYNGEKVTNTIKFKNTKENGLGIPLPSGIARFYQTGKDSAIQFAGEDLIANTGQDNEVTLTLGNAFDLKGERKLTSQENTSLKCTLSKYETTLTNSKDQEVTVKVLEHAYGDVVISESTHPYEKIGSTPPNYGNTLDYEFTAHVKPHSKETLTYSIKACYT